MKREATIDGNKTVIHTDFYLYLLELEVKNEDLKKQLEELQETNCFIQGGRSHSKTYLMKLQQDNDKYKTQQIDFIEYLENELVNGRSEENTWLMGYYDATKAILSKYKEIVNGIERS